MPKITKILIDRKQLKNLQRLGLISPYKKAVILLETGNLRQVDFKKRRPYNNEIYYFRINKQYRAIGDFIGDIFHVFEINDHQ